MLALSRDSNWWLQGGTRPSPEAKWFKVALILLAVLCYVRSLSGDLFFDNEPMILLDSRIRSMEGISSILTTQYWAGIGQTTLFRPVTTLSYLANYTVLGGGAEPFGYHLVNTFLHAAVAFCFLVLLLRLGLAPIVAFGASFVFAVHPLATESVANVVGRADILSALFVLLALTAHMRVRLLAKPGWRRVLPPSFFLLAMASKESGIVFIAMAMCYDLGPGRALPSAKEKKRWRLDYIGLVAVLIGMQLWRWFVIRDIAPREFDVGDNAMVLGSFLEREATVLKILALYFARLIWPLHLSADHSYPQIEVVKSLADPGFLIGLLIFVGWMILIIRTWLHKEFLICFLALFVPIAFAPVSNAIILIGTIMAERLMYLPMMGILALGAMTLVSIVKKIQPSRALFVSTVLFAMVTALFATRTVMRNGDWLTEQRFWKATHESSPRSLRAINGYARAVFKADPNDPDAALTIQKRSLDVGAESPRSLARLGEYASRSARLRATRGDASAMDLLEEARGYLDRAEALDLELRRAWASRNEWFLGHPDAAPMNEAAVFESQAEWFDAHRTWEIRQGRDWDDEMWNRYESMVKNWLVARPGAQPAYRWLKLGLDAGRPEVGIKAAPLTVSLAGRTPEVMSIVTELYRQMGVDLNRHAGEGRGPTRNWPQKPRGEKERRLYELLAAGWRVSARLYLAQGYSEFAQRVLGSAKRQGVPAEVFNGVFGATAPDPNSPDFWE